MGIFIKKKCRAYVIDRIATSDDVSRNSGIRTCRPPSWRVRVPRKMEDPPQRVKMFRYILWRRTVRQAPRFTPAFTKLRHAILYMICDRFFHSLIRSFYSSLTCDCCHDHPTHDEVVYPAIRKEEKLQTNLTFISSPIFSEHSLYLHTHAHCVHFVYVYTRPKFVYYFCLY